MSDVRNIVKVLKKQGRKGVDILKKMETRKPLTESEQNFVRNTIEKEEVFKTPIRETETLPTEAN